ncbi:SRPBCC family protein [uncultured Mycobacterium sp.]|uniref:SRPBCC family protein n=1 Tax=uncultured Mycobacterium sp. TaxID=171292 RepID=UPI0035C96314
MADGVMLTVDRVIAAAPQAVWKLLVDLDDWSRWGPPIRRAVLDSGYDHLTRHATGTVYTWLPVGVPFVITEFEPNRYWAWTVAGLPATSHRVDPVDGGARVTIGVPWWSAAYLTVCSIALRRIERLLVAPL